MGSKTKVIWTEYQHSKQSFFGVTFTHGGFYVGRELAKALLDREEFVNVRILVSSDGHLRVSKAPKGVGVALHRVGFRGHRFGGRLLLAMLPLQPKEKMKYVAKKVEEGVFEIDLTNAK